MPSPSDPDQRTQHLRSGLEQLNLPCDEGQVATLLQFADVLQHWNRRMNLIGSIDDMSLLTRHILDCAAIVPWVRGRRVVDIGSGAGLPGMVLAILAPGHEYCLLDSREKRTQFLKYAVQTLDLQSVEVACCRVEHYPGTMKFDTLVSRAFSRLDRFIALSNHLRADTGRWLAMKGRISDNELAFEELAFEQEVVSGNLRTTVEPLQVPFLEEERHLVIVAADH